MLPAAFPKVAVVAKVSPRGKRATVASLCQLASVECRVTGPSAGRVVYVSEEGEISAQREPGPAGDVSVGIPGELTREGAVLVLGILAYAVFDYAARESMRGHPESASAPPRGRPRAPQPLSGAERQRRWRARRGAREDVPAGRCS